MTIYEVFYNDTEALESWLYFEKPPQFDWLQKNTTKYVGNGYEWASAHEVDDDLALAAIPLEKILAFVSKQQSCDVLKALDAIVPEDEKGNSYVDKVLSSLTPAQVFGWLAEQSITGDISLEDSIHFGVEAEADSEIPKPKRGRPAKGEARYSYPTFPLDLKSYIPLKEELDAEIDERVKKVKPL